VHAALSRLQHVASIALVTQRGAAKAPIPMNRRSIPQRYFRIASGTCRYPLWTAFRVVSTRQINHMPKILVIDDDAVVRDTIVDLLQDVGYEVLSAEDGVRGMALFRSEQPDLVITDLIMPEQEGLQTITEMLKDKPNAKIIAISGAARVGKMDFLKIAEVLGAIDAIRKPFDPDQLLTAVGNCLASPAPGSNPERNAT